MDSQLLKGTLQTIVLKLLTDNGRMYGYELTQKVKSASGGSILITEGALYPALHKLQGEGFLRTSTEIVDGRARKYYSLTEHGGKAAGFKLAEAAEFFNNLQKVLNLNPAVK